MGYAPGFIDQVPSGLELVENEPCLGERRTEGPEAQEAEEPEGDDPDELSFFFRRYPEGVRFSTGEGEEVEEHRDTVELGENGTADALRCVIADDEFVGVYSDALRCKYAGKRLGNGDRRRFFPVGPLAVILRPEKGALRADAGPAIRHGFFQLRYSFGYPFVVFVVCFLSCTRLHRHPPSEKEISVLPFYHAPVPRRPAAFEWY